MRRALMFSMIVAGLAASTPAAANSTPALNDNLQQTERLADRLEFRADRLLDRVFEPRYTGVDRRNTSAFQEFAFATYHFWARVREDGEFHHGTVRAWQDVQLAWVEVQHTMRLSRASSRVRNAYVDAAEALRRLDRSYGETVARLERERREQNRDRPSSVVRYREAPARGAVVRRTRARDLDWAVRVALPGLRIGVGG